MAAQEEVLAFLSRPESYGAGQEAVSRIDTHISSVFLVGDRAFKLKRAVNLGYLDFSTADRRRFFCEREVLVNQRTAPGLYLRVLPITRRDDGTLVLGGEGEAVDWLVEMRRFPADATLDQWAARGKFDVSLAEHLADAIAGFHQALSPISDDGSGKAMRLVCESIAQALMAVPAAILEPRAVAELVAQQRAAIDQGAPLLDQRARAGQVRRCHGDLHLRNIVMLDGAIVPFDAIEFDEALAIIDVLYDLAFLIMDLHVCGLAEAASIVLNRYLDVTGDQSGLAALSLFLSLRAAIRAHVDATMAVSRPLTTAGSLIKDARRYFAAAQGYLQPHRPRVIAVGGLSGSGKSRLAKSLAPLIGAPPGARVVRSDVIRKRLAGADFFTRLDTAAYTPDQSRKVYAVLAHEADAAIKTGWSVIADAVFARADERDAIAAVACANDVAFHGLWLEAPLRCLEERVSQRQNDVSDATADVVRRQGGYDLGDMTWERVDAGSSADSTLAAAARALTLEVS